MFYFAPELNPLERTNSSENTGDVFVSGNYFKSIGCCSRLKVAHKALLSVPKQRVSTVFFYCKSFLISQMERTVKNATDVKHSSVQARVAHEKRQPRPTLLERFGKYLFPTPKKPRKKHLTNDCFKDLATRHFLYWLHCDERGLYFPESRDKRLMEGLQALRTAFDKRICQNN